MSRYVDVITNAIKDERCVLMLGPELWLGEDEQPLATKMTNFLQNDVGLKFGYDVDGMFKFESRSSRTFFYSDLRKFYDENANPSSIHKKISKIPFNVIINGSPDLSLKNAFEKLGVKYDFQFYNKKQNPKDIKKPTQERPLLYNFFGNIQEEDSLILTSDDLFDFLFSILGGENRLPRELQNTFRTARMFVFLGFDFNQWYLKLIMRLFELHKDVLPFSNKVEIPEGLQSFYIDNFELEFMNMEAKSFIDELYQRFSEENLLKEGSESQANPLTVQVRDLVKQGETEEALEILEDFLDGRSDVLLNVVIQQSGMYNRLQRQLLKGSITEAESANTVNKINNTILEIAEQVQEL